MGESYLSDIENIIQKKSAYPLGISKYFSTLSLQILTLKNRNYGKNCEN